MKRVIIRGRIFIITELLLYIVTTATMLLIAMWIVEPVAPFKYSVKVITPFLLITYFFLFLVFRIISFYYHSLLRQKNFIELLNSGLLRLGAHIEIDAILKESLDIFLNFYGGDKGIVLITDERIKEYASGDILTINVSKEKFSGEVNSTYSVFTFSPASISEEIDKKVKQCLLEYDFGRCREVIILPVGDRKKTKAVAIVGTSDSKRKNKSLLFEETKNEIDIFLRHLNIEVENSILHEEVNKASITDALTGLYNRRYFQKRIEQEFARAKRIGFPISIMISDLDNFKYYVDSYGHPKGDQILSELGSLVKSIVREGDVVCRFGGDEFAYLLPFTSSAEAKVFAERIRKNISKYVFLKGEVEKPVNLTLSIGIATFPEHGQTYEEIISKADQALFKSKSCGKNRITIYQEE